MAENEQAEGAEGEAAPAKKGKQKLVIAAVGFLAILGAGAGGFFFMRGHGEEVHAEAPPPKPPSFVEVPDMMVNLVGGPASACNISK
jgi:flagellar protein FliL